VSCGFTGKLLYGMLHRRRSLTEIHYWCSSRECFAKIPFSGGFSAKGFIDKELLLEALMARAIAMRQGLR
jgi:hypothetical protein